MDLVPVASHQNALVANLSRHEIARVTNLTFVPGVEPLAGEDKLHLAGEPLGREVVLAREACEDLTGVTRWSQLGGVKHKISFSFLGCGKDEKEITVPASILLPRCEFPLGGVSKRRSLDWRVLAGRRIEPSCVNFPIESFQIHRNFPGGRHIGDRKAPVWNPRRDRPVGSATKAGHQDSVFCFW